MLELLCQIPSVSLGKLATSVSASSIAVAHLVTLYWTTCIVLYGLVRGHLLSRDAVAENVVLTRLKQDEGNRKRDPMVSCRLLLQMMPLFFQPEVGQFRLHLITFPLSVAFLYLRDSGSGKEVAGELQPVVDGLNQPTCEGIRKFLLSLSP